jgi:MFS transporter, NNP family, nitrate/nitrite transporter
MFQKDVVGFANALVAGWGNMGGGVTQVLMVAIVAWLQGLVSDDLAWRLSFLVPGAGLIVVALATLWLGDDCPEVGASFS